MGVAVPFPDAECVYIATANSIWSARDGVARVALALEEEVVNLIFS